MVGGAPGQLQLHALKATALQIQLINEHVNDPDRVILSDVVIQMLGKKRALGTIFAFDKSLHQSLPPLQWESSKLPKLSTFSHGLGRSRTVHPPSARTAASGNLIRRIPAHEPTPGCCRCLSVTGKSQ